MRDSLTIPARPVLVGVGIAALGLLPPVLLAIDQPFYILLATRMLVFALAATSLNLLIGYGGMVSFGHAVFLGAGAYAAAVLMGGGIVSAWLIWPAAMLVAAALAFLIGAASLRTHGVYFIMITLAFAQMAYYVIVSLKLLGSDDGLGLPQRPSFGLGLDPRSDATFYYVALAIFVLGLVLFRQLLNARIGRALQGVRDNEQRMEAIGFPTFRLKLAWFVIAGAAAGLAGAMLASLNGNVGPSLLHWTQSGMLMIMVILGGAGRLLGGAAGAVLLLALEEALSEYTIHWQLGIGLFLLLVVLFLPEGLAGLWRRAAK